MIKQLPFLFFLIFILLCCKAALAEPPLQALTQLQNKSQASKQIVSLLATEGREAKNGVQFYQAGVDCHRNSLPAITYFIRKNGIFFFFNDTLNNCYLGLVPISTPEASSIAASCIISDSQYEKMFTPWFLDGLKNLDATQNINATAQQFIKLVADCLKPMADTALLSILVERKAKN